MCLGSLCLNCDGSRKSADSPRKSRNGPRKRNEPPRKPTAAHSARIIIDIPAPDCHNKYRNGDIAQLGERCLRKAEAEGSNPFISTMTLTRAETRAFFIPPSAWADTTGGEKPLGSALSPNTLTFSAYDVCELCPRRCHAQRNAGKAGLCGAFKHHSCGSSALHSGKSLLSRARLDRVQFSSQVARSDVCSVRTTKSRKRVLASQLQPSALPR